VFRYRSLLRCNHHTPLLAVVVESCCIMFSVARTSLLRQARTQLRQPQPVTVLQRSTLARLLSTLAVLEQRDGKLQNSSLAAITAGTKLGGSITAFVAGSGAKSVADEAAKVKGIEKIIYVDSDAYNRVRSLRFLPCSCAKLPAGPA
jgi:electron transfer flavoprotein alpha subunit